MKCLSRETWNLSLDCEYQLRTMEKGLGSRRTVEPGVPLPKMWLIPLVMLCVANSSAKRLTSHQHLGCLSNHIDGLCFPSPSFVNLRRLRYAWWGGGVGAIDALSSASSY